MDGIWTRNKNDTLDPLSVIIKLYICSYKPLGTKISIFNNRLCIQNAGNFQGLVRTVYGDNKNDIPILTMPILYACNKYLITNRDKYTLLFKKACLALSKLKETYQGNEIIYNLDTLKDYISSFLNEDVNVSNVNNSSSYNSEGGKIKRTIYDNISNIWTTSRLETVFNLIYEIDRNNEQCKEILLSTLYNFMMFVDELAHGIILGLG